MKARIWGCRGSLATPGPETVRYGGDTSCIEVRTSNGSLVVLDAGTGVRPLGLSLAGSGLAVAGDADVLLHDAQFTDEEYVTRAGWGHSAMSDFVTYLAAAAPKRALMFHHDPAHADGQLEAMLAGVREATGNDAVELA